MFSRVGLHDQGDVDHRIGAAHIGNGEAEPVLVEVVADGAEGQVRQGLFAQSCGGGLVVVGFLTIVCAILASHGAAQTDLVGFAVAQITRHRVAGAIAGPIGRPV